MMDVTVYWLFGAALGISLTNLAYILFYAIHSRSHELLEEQATLDKMITSIDLAMERITKKGEN